MLDPMTAPRQLPSLGRARGRTVSAAAVVLATSLALSACGAAGDDTPAGEKGPDGQNTAPGSSLQGEWPLTGLPASGNAPKRPVMVVKIDNTESSSPQLGLSKADLVTEELVEGGSTRLAVFYYSKVPKVVGPVRSFRATDIGIVKPAKAVVVASGGASQTVARIHQAGIKTFTEGATGFYRDSGRSAPYNLFMALPKLARTLKKLARTPQGYLPWGGDFPGGPKAKAFTAQFSGMHSTSWKYQHGRYVNLNSNAAAGDQFRPDSVLVLRVDVGDAGYKDPAGNPVPETHFFGKGSAMLFHHGEVVRGTWVKRGATGRLTLRTKSGSLAMPAGHTWIELVPANGGNVTISR